MSISYEEALETLESMFGSPWTRETLDAVLRHYKGHMENTVDCILRHGDRDPQVLVDQLQAGINPEESATLQDEQLARQLALEGTGRGAAVAAPAAAPTKKGRGTPTTLPDDFLRLPGYKLPASSSTVAPASTASAARTTSTSDSQVMSDEALARMLQDELFSDELARNPDFAHLARGRPRTSGGMPIRTTSGSGREPPQRRPSNPMLQTQNIVKGLQELGDNTKRRLQMMAAQFNANVNRGGVAQAQGTAGGPTSPSERRGLLDDDNDDMELAARKDL